MKYKALAPWEHYPKHLTHYEMMHPIQVLDDFFSADSLDGHNAMLKRWQQDVLSDKPYKDQRHGPVSLVFTYGVNVKLLEAMYLLLLEHKQYWLKPEPVSEAQLAAEKASCSCYPESLTIRELLNPYKVVNKVFKVMRLHEYREQLQHWLDQALTRRRVNEHIGARELLLVYENLLKLYAAAWLFYQRSRPVLPVAAPLPGIHDAPPAAMHEMNGQQHTSVNVDSHRLADKAIAFLPGQAANNLTPAQSLGLQEVVKLILEAESSVAFIGCLGIHNEPFTYYLLILTEDHTEGRGVDLADRLQARCNRLVPTFPLVHKARVASEGISEQSRFWVEAFATCHVAYRSPQLELPPVEPLSTEAIRSHTAARWQRWSGQAGSFLDGAAFYSRQGDQRLALFSLHQSAEGTLAGIIRVLCGYRFATHSLNKMLKFTLLYTERLRAVFELDTEQGREVFHLLQAAYSDARYKAAYAPDPQLVASLSEKVTRLLETAHQMYDEFMTGISAGEMQG